MSFKEFDMSEYYNVLEDFKKGNKDKVISQFESVNKFDEIIEKIKAEKAKLAKIAIKEYGSGVSKFIGEATKFYSESNK